MLELDGLPSEQYTAARNEFSRLLNRRSCNGPRLREVEAECEEAENGHGAAESELDAVGDHITDMQTAIQGLLEELDQARRELRAAESRTRKLEHALTKGSHAVHRSTGPTVG